ncbi:MAG: hypothetical protein HQL24_04065 [Candidatus Omnitrophica bacterium]|nr:hypothetical protein [Candidatus Omnitrophota bacterium]
MMYLDHKETKLWLPRQENVLLIDDGGSVSENLLCFSCILINKDIELILQNKLNKNGVSFLHARSMRGKYNQARLDYEKAFTIFYEVLKRTKYKFSCILFAEKQTFQNIGEGHRRAFEKCCRVSSFGRLDNTLKQIFQQGIFPVMEVLRKVAEIPNYPKINLTIKLANSGHMWKFTRRITIPNQKTLIDFINFHLQKNYGDRFYVSDFRIDSAQQEPVMSIVDALANFTFNYIRATIKAGQRNISDGERMKSEVFKKVLLKTESATYVEEFDSKLKGDLYYEGERIVSRNKNYVYLNFE